jgi:two-component system, NtrC family, response regulator HydG
MASELNILVVDDDVDNAMSLGEVFELEGHRVRAVFSGQDAIDACINSQFDLAFIDVMMPGKNGVESFLEIRRLRPQARVYMMTGYSVEELLQQAVREGAMGYLEKPFDPGEVLRITEAVGRGGLVVAVPPAPQHAVGDAIERALADSGQACCRVRDAAGLASPVQTQGVVIIEAPLPLIDAVSSYQTMRGIGLENPTIIVPPTQTVTGPAELALADVGVTGILNKPFDTLALLNRLPQLAA